MSKINRIPKALQELLGNTSQGVNPSELLSEVRPSFDMVKFWALDKVDYIASTASAAAVFANSFVQVPQGEVWIPLTLSADITMTVIGEGAQIVIGIANNSRLARCHIAQSEYRTTTTAIETIAAVYEFPQMILLGAGDSVYYQIHFFSAAGARTTGLDLRFIRLLA